jgi:class 3 adenylate cyclase
MQIFYNLSELDSAQGNYQQSLMHYKMYITARDSLYNEENTKKIVQSEMQYAFDKKESLEKKEQEKKDAVAKKELQKQKLVRNGFVGGFAVVLLFAGVFFTQRNKIKKGKKRSDELLLNILPEEVANELKEKGSADAKQFDDVTVMFTDFKNFTQISEKLSPAELVAEIHTCFKAFDNIIGKHNIEKIKTIGDSYMCAGGLPVANTTNATDVVNAAMQIQKFMQEHLQQRKNEGKEVFEIRIGINTGPVVAGIVGVKKFAYDIWGDTVNIASRMESSGEAGKVNISGSTYELVKDLPAGKAGKFTFTHRGKIQAKNKGEIDMYFVEHA